MDHRFRQSESERTQLMSIFSGQFRDSRARPILDDLRLLNTTQDRGSGSPPGTSLTALPQAESPLHRSIHCREANQRGHLSPTYRISPSFHVCLLKPFTEPLVPSSPGSGSDDVPPPPLEAESERIYQVNTLLNSRRRSSRLEYLIDWEGYGPEEKS